MDISMESIGVIQVFKIMAGLLEICEQRKSTITYQNGQFFTYLDYSKKESKEFVSFHAKNVRKMPKNTVIYI